jgi:hypothetical protein
MKIKKTIVGLIDRMVNSYTPEKSLENWIYYWLHFQNFGYAKDFGPKNCYYEFGTGWGGTLTSFLKASKRFSRDYNFDLSKLKIVLFDSFEGLPEVKAKEDDHPEWGKGKFAYSKDHISQIIRNHGFPLENVTFIEGFFENTLNEKTLERMRLAPPSIITVDVDYYSSTKLMLDFLVPLLNSGVTFYFDDIHSFFLHPDMGQLKAISEFNGMDTGALNVLTDVNYLGKCYIYTRKNWEYTNKN